MEASTILKEFLANPTTSNLAPSFVTSSANDLSMIQLSREIRFALLPRDMAYPATATNSWSGWPTTNLAVPHLNLRAVIAGEPDPVTGYVCNIKILDRLLREVVTESLIQKFGNQPVFGATIIRTAFDEVEKRWRLPDALIRIELSLSPYLRYAIHTGNSNMIEMTQQFEFSAAHRLHCDSLTEEENRETFGKCNNPNGHGHNYVLDVTVGSEVDAKGTTKGSAINLNDFERTVKEEIIDRLDHKHLNRDVDYFADVNPSVENIAIAIYRWLEKKLDAELVSVKVFETPKTWAQYRGD